MYRIDQAGAIPPGQDQDFNQEPAPGFHWTACPFSTKGLLFLIGPTDRLPRNRALAGYGTIFT